MDNEILAKVERQRLELEENITKLRKSLRHWQTLEIDYEGLKEEFQLLPEDTSYQECFQAAKSFEPELVDERELQSLFDDKQTSHRSPSRLVEILSKRIDYVIRNVSTIRKQLSDAEKKRNALLLAENPQHQDEAGLPLSEITEELDEDGGIISSTVQMPGKDAPDLLDVLRKAGVPDIKDGVVDTPGYADTEDAEKSHALSDIVADETSMHLGVAPTSFLPPKKRAEEILDSYESDSEDSGLGPVNPDDTEEDAALRLEMLQYGLNEVGAIVAELDLADAGDLSDDEDGGDYLSDYNEDEDLYTDESEDERGATKTPVISERYKREMEALSKKHGISGLTNLGPGSKLPEVIEQQSDRPPAAEAARQAAIARAETTRSVLKPTYAEGQSASKPKAKKKQVAFAPSLDIATEALGPRTAVQAEPAVHPVGDTIVERGASEDAVTAASTAGVQPSAGKKVSRFKAARSAAPPTPMFPPLMEYHSSSEQKTTPEGPLGQTISHKLVERPASKMSAPADPLDFDEEMHRNEIAIDLQKMRNRKIHAQGGYVRGGQEENYGEAISSRAVVDENTGRERKVSRFKAARLSVDDSTTESQHSSYQST